MSSAEELDFLAQRKAVLLARIAQRRDDCADAFAELAPQLAPIETMYGRWQRISAETKASGAPMALAVVKTVASNLGGVAGLLRFVPTLLGVARRVTAPARAPARPRRAPPPRNLPPAE